MCFSNLIQIFPNTHVIKTTDKAKGLPSTINEAKPKLEYSKQDLIALGHSNVNLTGLPTGTISTIRGLKLNKKNIRKTKHREQFEQTEVNFCNLHVVQTVNQDMNEIVNTVRIAHIYSRSIKYKDDLIAEYIDSTKIDFTIITETWLQDNEINKGWVSTTSLNNSNYKISTENCKTGEGGGIALVMREEYYVKKLDKSTTYDSFEHVIWSTRISNRDYTLIGTYHPPQGTQQAITNSNFITEFTEFLTDVTSKHNNILTMGDFNIHMDNLEDVDSCLLHDTINAFNLKQQVNIPMHNLGHILDLIITENLQEYEVEKIILGPYLSDHQFITIQLTECKPKVQQLLMKYRRIPTDIMQGFNRHFNNQSVLETTDLDQAIDQFQSELQRTLDQIAPEKLLKMRNGNKKPLFDKELYDQRRIMKNRERLWLKYQNATQWKAYTRERNRFNTMLKFKKHHSLHTLILEKTTQNHQQYDQWKNPESNATQQNQ